MSLLRPERRARISQFATEWGLRNPRVVKSIDRGLNITFKAPCDLETAQGRIEAVQTAKPESEKRHGISKILTSKPKASKYKAREITAALQSVVQDAGPPGVVEVLLELLLQHEGDVNIIRRSTTKWKRIAKVDQEDIRTDLLSTATRAGNINTMQLLLPKADDISINQSLGIALNAGPHSRNLDIIELLLAYGADASLYPGVFDTAVRTSDRDLVGLLLSAQKGISIPTMTDALYSAVETCALEMAYILAQTNADADAENGKALRQAISTARHEFVIIMTLCNHPPSQSSLDEAVPFIFSNATTSNHQKKVLLEALLFGGATGSHAAPVLLELVKQCTVRNAVEAGADPLVTMIICLIDANTSLDYENAAALKNIISSSRIDLLDIFLSSNNFNERLASIAFSSIDLSATPDLRVTIMSKLLAKGASGIPLHEALIYAVKTDHTAAINLLVAGNGFSKASVDFRDAAAIKDATSREKIQVVKLLLASGNPQPSSASSAFPHIWKCSKNGRLELALELLNHGAAGVNISIGLLRALEDRDYNRDHELMKLLVREGADLGFENGRALELATEFFDMIGLEILLAKKPPPQYLKAAFASAMALRPTENRFVACDMLLKAGATGNGVNKALTIAVSEECSDTSFLKILVPTANINYNGGQALSEAIKRCHANHASLLLEQNPRLNETSFINAFDAASSHTQSAEEIKYCRMILQASPPEKSTSMALLKAVRRACNEELCRLFLQHKTNLNYDGGICLIAAVHGQNIKILTLLVESTNPKPSKNSLEAAFNAAFGVTDETCRLGMVQILLNAGVKGDSVDAALINQAKRGDMNVTLCLMLLKYGASIDAQNGEPLVIAAKLGAISLLQTMLQGRKAAHSSLVRAFKSADHNRIDLVNIFLDAGLTGESLHSALATQAKRGNDGLSICALLLAHGASGDEYNGEALTTAARLAALPLLQAIIQQKISDLSLTRAFKSADHQNLDLIKIFLDAGLKGEPLHTTLVEQSQRGNEGLAVCTLLLAHGASVNEYNGEALTIVAKLEALLLLEAMLKDSMVSKATLTRAFKSANHGNLNLVKMFLDVGLNGEPLDTALAEQSKIGNKAIAVCQLLLTHGASVDANHGEALTNAASLNALLLLQELLRERPVSNATLTRAFQSADRGNIDLVKILLDAGLKGVPLHSALIEQSRRGNDALAVCTLLLTHGASIDANNGEALANAARLSAVPLLRMMLQRQGILNESLTWAFAAVGHEQYEIIELFLKAGLHGEAVHSALVLQTQRGDRGLTTCELLLNHGADINEYDGEALNEAAASGNVKLMQAMLHGRKATPKILSRAFGSALQSPDQPRFIMIQLLAGAGLQAGPEVDIGLLDLVQSGSKDINSMRELLKLGASIHHNNHGALDAAVQLCHHKVLLLLLEYLTDASALSLVFGAKLRKSWSNLTEEMIGIMEILLKHGAQGEDVQSALLLAISESDTNPLAHSFAQILLNHDVDVNYEQGRPLQIAAEIAALDFLSIMIAKGATPESLAMAFPYIFKVQPQANEATMESLIRLFQEHAGEQLVSVVRPTLFHPPVFMSIYNYPESSQVLKAVLDAGFAVDEKMLHPLSEIGDIEITPLYWALLEYEKTVTEPVVYMLLQRGASVEGHPTPLLHSAIKKGYSSVVQLLIEAGADVDCADAANETPLLLAYQSGNLSTIKALLKAECEPDDGTLHDAARRLDVKVIELLLEHDHDPNRPSPEHEGRTALAELVYHAPIFAKRNSDKNLERDAKKSIKLMAKEGARTNIQTKTADDTEKSLLLLALDSQNPLVMTKALLDADQWKFVNEDFNLYNDGVYTYSSAMYVEKGIWAGDPAQVKSVLNLLKSFQVKRRFWKNHGDQPEDMLDAPPEITAAENARKATLAEALRKETEKQARLAQIEEEKRAKIAEANAEALAEYTRRSKKAEFDRALANEDLEAELAAQGRSREFEIKYQENLIELEQRKKQVAIDEQLRKQQGLADIQLRLQAQTNEQTLRVLEEKRRNLQEKSKAGYMVMDVYDGMQRTGLGVVGGSSRAAIGGPPARRMIQHGHISDSDDDY